MLDIFKTDPFGVIALTEAINTVPFVPGRVGQMGLFSSSSVAALTVMIEEKAGVLNLIAPTPRGGPGQTIPKQKRGLRALVIPHFEINDAINADEVQGVRAFGTETELETVMGKVAERMVDHTQSHAVTEEHARVGAIKGIITYADGSTLDLFEAFGVSQAAEIDFDLDNPAPGEGILRKKCATVVRKVADELGGLPYGYVHAMVGDAFFDDLLSHPEVRETYKGTDMAAVLRAGYLKPDGSKIYGAFEFGDIVWENYRGKVGATSFVDTDKAHFFPVAGGGLFKTVYGPADYIETVNTLGKRLYMKTIPWPNDKGVGLDSQSNALQFCTRPKVLLKGKRT